jgi:hypothetical protein
VICHVHTAVAEGDAMVKTKIAVGFKKVIVRKAGGEKDKRDIV